MPLIDYSALRARIKIRQVLGLLEFQAFRSRGDELRGPCPLHGGRSARSTSFSADLAKNAFRCFTCGAQGNQLDLWAAALKLPLYPATLDLCQRLGEEIPVRNGRSGKPVRADHRAPPR